MSSVNTFTPATDFRVECHGDILEVCFCDGRQVLAPLRALPGLFAATSAQLDNWMLVDDGRTLSWPELGRTIPVHEVRDASSHMV